MNQPSRKSMTTLGLALLLAIVAAHAEDSALARDADADPRGRQIEGTWIATVTPAPGAPSFTGYSSYIRGGAFIVSADRFPPAFGTAVGNSQGSWRAAAHGEFVSTHLGILRSVAGDVVGTFKIRASVRLTTDDTFEGHGQLQLCDATFENCAPPFPGLSNVTGRRLHAQGPILP